MMLLTLGIETKELQEVYCLKSLTTNIFIGMTLILSNFQTSLNIKFTESIWLKLLENGDRIRPKLQSASEAQMAMNW
eukprot:8294148-Heterocapsa_arctica.AAC.1